MRRRTLLAGLPLLALTPPFTHGALAHPPRQPDPAEAKKFIQEVTDFRSKLAKAVLAKDFAALRRRT